MKVEFEKKLKELLKEYDAYILGMNSGILYDSENDLLIIEGLLIEVNREEAIK
ncbi:hypothetical protein VBH15_09425 [Vagococcus fluvialis]|uniref:hypothetical protein n=1 Tax=Vagococcus fluvialis TaxID=2738 RepID=UPI0037D41008